MKFVSLRFALGLVLIGPTLAAKSYYVSASSGNDRNNGTTAAAPWQTLAKVNALSLAAGDQIFLKAGDKFLDAGLVFLADDRGTAANPIVVDTYDGTARAIIMAPPSQHGINIYNTGGITVRNLHLLGQGPVASDANERAGVSLWCDLKKGERLSGLRFEGLFISWFYQGIVIGAGDPSYSGFADVVIADSTVKSCLANGIVSFGHMPGSAEMQSHANLQILRTNISQCYGDPTLKGPHSGSGIILAGTVGGLIDHCVAHDNGGGTNDNSGGGPVGIWCWGCHGVIIQHCLVYNQKTTEGAQDGGGFDIDGGSTGCTIQYCYSYHNEGYGYLVCEFGGATPITGATVRYNISWQDGRARKQAGLGLYNGNPSADSFREVTFHNNIVVCDDTADSIVKLGFESGPLSAAFYNNLFVRTAGTRMVNLDRHMDTVTFKGNLYWATSGPLEWLWGNGTFTALDAWRAAAGQPETHLGKPVGVVADPRLCDPVNGFAATTGEPENLALPRERRRDPWNGFGATSIEQLITMAAFIPRADSAAVNAALDITTPEFGRIPLGGYDFKGTVLPRGASDIGAYDQ